MVCLILPTYSVYLCPGVGLDIFLGDRNVFCLTTCFSSQLPSYQSLNSSVIWDDKMNTNMNQKEMQQSITSELLIRGKI